MVPRPLSQATESGRGDVAEHVFSQEVLGAASLFTISCSAQRILQEPCTRQSGRQRVWKQGSCCWNQSAKDRGHQKPGQAPDRASPPAQGQQQWGQSLGRPDFPTLPSTEEAQRGQGGLAQDHMVRVTELLQPRTPDCHGPVCKSSPTRGRGKSRTQALILCFRPSLLHLLFLRGT